MAILGILYNTWIELDDTFENVFANELNYSVLARFNAIQSGGGGAC